MQTKPPVSASPPTSSAPLAEVLQADVLVIGGHELNFSAPDPPPLDPWQTSFELEVAE